MKKVIILKGLPASGKSTWAKEMVDKYPGQYKRINKDDLRSMIDNGKWSKENEKFILGVRDRLISAALDNLKIAIVDDTNFESKHEEQIKLIAASHGCPVEIKTFDTPLEECIARDAKRDKPVGEKVIRDMHDRYLKKPESVALAAPYNPDLPDCIIVDIDGTLALMNGRGPHDYHRVGEDLPNEPIIDLASTLGWYKNNVVCIFSGRPESCREETETWLSANFQMYDNLFMRTTGDHRKDYIVKQELYEKHIKGKYNVLWVIDDRNQVVQMWRSLGLTCLQVADGNF
jgi:predicted kinase